MLSFGRGRIKKIEGFIASAGLIEWWLGQFDEQERYVIDQIYRPMGSSPDVESVLTTGPIRDGSVDAAGTLSNVASWLKKAEDRTIAYRFLDKAEELLAQSTNILTAHFLHQIECQVFYRWRDLDDFALQRAITACEKQIAISPQVAAYFRESPDWGFLPSHHCFKQIAIIKEKAGECQQAIDYCERAKAEGWKGDWDKRIARLKKQLAKQ